MSDDPNTPENPSDFFKKRGEGLHHICYRVADLQKAMKKIVGKKMRLRDKKPRPGGGGSKIVFLEPKSIFNTETEFVERMSEV